MRCATRMLAAALIAGGIGWCMGCAKAPKAPTTGEDVGALPGEVGPAEAVSQPAEPPVRPRPGRRVGSHEEFWLGIVGPPAYEKEGGLALVAHGLEVSAAEYLAGLEKFRVTHPDEPETAYRDQVREQLSILRWLEQSGEASSPEFRARAREAMRATLVAVALEEQERAVTVTEEDIQARYASDIALYQTPEKVHVQMIQVATDEEAQAMLARLAEGEEFGALAAAHSRHESRRQSGEVDPFARGTFNRSVEDVAFALNPGEVGVATTAAGAIILRKLANIPATLVPLEEVHEQVREQVLEQKRADRRRRVLNQVQRDLRPPAAP